MMCFPDIRCGHPVPRHNDQGKPLKPAQYVFVQCRRCAQPSAVPITRNGTVVKGLKGCPFCSAQR